MDWRRCRGARVVGYNVGRISKEELALADISPEEITEDNADDLAYCEMVGSCWGFYPASDADELGYAWEQAIAEADADALARSAAE
jgi:hypothetical protein